MNTIPLAAHSEPGPSIYERAGGPELFFKVAAHFYDAVSRDPVLRPHYPADLSDNAWWLALFLIQYCGGPDDYSRQKGHPRLRMRHAPFAIGVAERDAWVNNMRNAVEAHVDDAHIKAYLLDYFERTATFLINTKED